MSKDFIGMTGRQIMEQFGYTYKLGNNKLFYGIYTKPGIIKDMVIEHSDQTLEPNEVMIITGLTGINTEFVGACIIGVDDELSLIDMKEYSDTCGLEAFIYKGENLMESRTIDELLIYLKLVL